MKRLGISLLVGIIAAVVLYTCTMGERELHETAFAVKDMNERYAGEVCGYADRIKQICIDNEGEECVDAALLDSILYLAIEIEDCRNNADSILEDVISDALKLYDR